MKDTKENNDTIKGESRRKRINKNWTEIKKEKINDNVERTIENKGK
jgi:hypothetical protein